MKPTREYLAAPEIARSRDEASHGTRHVVVENVTTQQYLGGKSTVYLSVDDGVTFAVLDWNVAMLGRLKLLVREWPPHDVRIEHLDDTALRLSYCEHTYDGPVDYRASYCFDNKTWRL